MGETKYRRVDGGENGGEYVTKEYADAHPDTTVAEHDREEKQAIDSIVASADEVDQASDRGVLSEDAVPD